MENDVIEGIIREMWTARRLLFITGAGISADSGLPTYRGIGGLYEDHLTEEGMPIEVALSGDMMRAEPALCWKYIYSIESACRGARCNAGHRALAEMQDVFTVCILTQNVDALHRAAGSRNVIEIHGNLHNLYCSACPYRTSVEDYSHLSIPPACPECGAVVRPDVVLFGELLPQAAIDRLYSELAQGFDLVFSIGTSSGFPYIAQPVIEANQRGIATVEINPATSEVSAFVRYKLDAGAAAALSTLWRRYAQSTH